MENDNQKTTTYSDIQNVLDQLIGKHGVKKTYTMLAVFSDNKKIEVSDRGYKLRRIKAHVVEQSILLFDLKKSEFYHSMIPEYRQARMACYHILYDYTSSSFAKIGEEFDRKLDSIHRYYNKCQGLLDSSHLNLNKKFIDKYTNLERSTINFILTLK